MSKLIVFAVLVSCAAAKAPGAVGLDSLTFDKIVDGSRPVLVKFDKEYPYGEKEDTFKALCKTVGPLKADLLIGEVGVQDFGDKQNDDVRERFNVDKDKFPVYKLFKKGAPTDAPVEFTGDVTETALLAFLKAETGLYIGLPGNIESMDKLAQGFLSADTTSAKERLASAEAALDAVSSAEKDSARKYVKIMKRVIDMGASYIEQETQRVKKLQGGKITDKKKKFFGERLNILSSFTKDEL